MSTLAGKIEQGYVMEDENQKDKQISASGINNKVTGNEIQGTPIIDITREQWFWDMGVMS